MGGIQWCYHSTETSLTNLFQSTIYFLEFSNRNLIFCDYFFGLTVRPGKRITRKDVKDVGSKLGDEQITKIMIF